MNRYGLSVFLFLICLGTGEILASQREYVPTEEQPSRKLQKIIPPKLKGSDVVVDSKEGDDPRRRRQQPAEEKKEAASPPVGLSDLASEEPVIVPKRKLRVDPRWNPDISSALYNAPATGVRFRIEHAQVMQ